MIDFSSRSVAWYGVGGTKGTSVISDADSPIIFEMPQARL